METSCKRPTFKSDINLIKVRGTGSSEVVAYVPVKPMISFTGFVDFKNATEFDRENIISDLAINVTNKDNTFTQTIYPDSTGMFYIFDIIPDDYTFTFEYRGDDYVVDKYKENVKLLYTDKNRGENEHGMFYIFDIIPDDYTFTFEYRGDDYVVDKYKENVKLLYTDKNRGENEHTFILNKGE